MLCSCCVIHTRIHPLHHVKKKQIRLPFPSKTTTKRIFVTCFCTMMKREKKLCGYGMQLICFFPFFQYQLHMCNVSRCTLSSAVNRVDFHFCQKIRVHKSSTHFVCWFKFGPIILRFYPKLSLRNCACANLFLINGL